MLLHTKNEMEAIHKDRVAELVEHAGSWYYLARMLGLDPATVKGWSERGRISKRGAELVEKHPRLGELFKAEELRLDIDFWK